MRNVKITRFGTYFPVRSASNLVSRKKAPSPTRSNTRRAELRKLRVMPYPLSRDEHAAMLRYISGIRRQLQDASDLLSSRYGKSSNLAEISVKALVCTTLLEHELLLIESQSNSESPIAQEALKSSA
jgi:hypothetical protein